MSADGAVLAPRDLEAGGTWLGLNRHGVFVAITNRFLGPRDPARVSRGVLVADALAQTSARAVHERLASVPAARHNGFHLVYADAAGGDVLATVSDGATRTQLVLGRGLHVVTERSFGAGDDRGRLARIHRAFEAARTAAGGGPLGVSASPAFTRVLAEHDDASPFDATCIHAESLRYGTRSAMVLAVEGPTKAARMLWAEGPPCRTPFLEVPEASSLLS